MKHATVLLLALASCLQVFAADVPRPVGPNCQLSSPPESAGEEIGHGMVLRIFPRAKDIDSNYTGCQAILAPIEGKWVVVSITEVVNGDPTRIWSEHEPNPKVLNCLFKQTKLVRGNLGTCPKPESLLVKSMAPGCARVIDENVAKSGVGTPWPPECNYQ